MNNNDKKGFSGLSNIETKVEESSQSAAHQPERQSQTGNDQKPAMDSRPPISSIPIQQPTPALDFLKKYWVLVVVGLILIWLSIGNKSSTPTHSSDYTLSESIPPYGSGNVLDASQIYYCLAEKVRIEANRATVNQYDNYAIDRFNQTINDYNARCSNYRYKQSAMVSAKNALDANRYSIQAQGSSRM